jgi:hypothetical protein
MKILQSIIVFFSFIILLCSSIPQSKSELIYWSKDYKLTWNDFKASPKNISTNAAITSAGFGIEPYTISSNSDSVVLNMNVFFVKNESWVKQNAKTLPLLNHEQCHFDINELYARKFRQQIKKYKFTNASFLENFPKLFLKYQNERDAYQNLYDKQTDHSRIQAKQLEWELKVAKELEILEAFSETTIIIRFATKAKKNKS